MINNSGSSFTPLTQADHKANRDYHDKPLKLKSWAKKEIIFSESKHAQAVLLLSLPS